MKDPHLEIDVRHRALANLLAQCDYYNGQVPGLGDRLWAEILEALEWLQTNYRTPPRVKGRSDLQRLITTRGVFRWLIYFRVQKGEVVVPWICHPRQRPRY